MNKVVLCRQVINVYMICYANVKIMVPDVI